jgi:hypothetical protein
MAPGVLGPRHGRRARWLPIFGSLGPLREECLGVLALHTSTRDEPLICRILVPNLISIVRQPTLLAAVAAT